MYVEVRREVEEEKEAGEREEVGPPHLSGFGGLEGNVLRPCLCPVCPSLRYSEEGQYQRARPLSYLRNSQASALLPAFPGGLAQMFGDEDAKEVDIASEVSLLSSVSFFDVASSTSIKFENIFVDQMDAATQDLLQVRALAGGGSWRS